MNNLAPIVYFTYNRLDTLQRSVKSLQANDLSKDSVLYIYSDAPKSERDFDAVQRVRTFLKDISGFKDIIIFEASTNKGLAKSIIEGVTHVINKHGKIIVLEDDLLLAPNFLSFMNKSLIKYIDNPKVFSISGFMFDIKHKKDYPYDVFFTKRHCSWGWAMWKDRWNEIDWEVKDFAEFIKDTSKRKAFNDIGADLTYSLIKQQKGKINSWAIRCNYHQFKKQTFTVYPLISKIDNLGFGNDATHTKQRFNKYKTTIDTKKTEDFIFPNEVVIDNTLINRFKMKYSNLNRLYYIILNTIFK